MDYQQKAVKLFMQGYNCAQSVFAAFCDEIGMDFDDALKLSSSFGGGMGKLREVCGAVSAMFMIAGIERGYTDPRDDEAKAEHYRLIQSLAEQFKREQKSIVCRELLEAVEGTDTPLPEPRSDVYYARRPCAGIVGCAARIVGENFFKV